MLQDILTERKSTHGDFRKQFAAAQAIKNVMLAHGLHGLSDLQIETLDLIATKQSRILTGNADHADHWRDIAGYATLIADMLDYLPKKDAEPLVDRSSLFDSHPGVIVKTGRVPIYGRYIHENGSITRIVEDVKELQSSNASSST